jgi:AcrR family transcriptional regulator
MLESGQSSGQQGAGSAPAVVPLRQRKKDRTRRQILAAALELFEQQGYEHTSVEQIAARAEISPATFFRYFGSKDEVLFFDEQDAADDLAALVAARSDRAVTLAALVEPVVRYSESASVQSSHGERRMRMIMSTRALETRSLHMRLLWERAMACQFALESGQPSPSFEQNVLASLAVSCHVTALRDWPAAVGAASMSGSPVPSVVDLTRRAFSVLLSGGHVARASPLNMAHRSNVSASTAHRVATVVATVKGTPS